MDELVRQGKRDLTVIANHTAMSGVGIGWAQKLRYRLCQESGRGGCAAPAQ